MTTLRATLPLVDSAVLAPVYRDPQGRLGLVFIRRSPFGVHGGQIAFPGGRREPEDPDLLTTALREAEEEIGLDRRSVEVLTTLPVIETVATGFRVAPSLGRLNGPPPTWCRQETEIDEILEVPLEDLLDPEAHDVEFWQLPGWPAPREIPFYRIGPYKLWGATYKIVGSIREYLASHEV
jgi:8-oxo-dGTP pyrophosphatase MutT (NUDIX family)